MKNGKQYEPFLNYLLTGVVLENSKAKRVKGFVSRGFSYLKGKVTGILGRKRVFDGKNELEDDKKGLKEEN